MLTLNDDGFRRMEGVMNWSAEEVSWIYIFSEPLPCYLSLLFLLFCHRSSLFLFFFNPFCLYNCITGDVLSHKQTHALQGFCVVGYRPGIIYRLERVCAVSSEDKHAVWRATWWFTLFLYTVLIIFSWHVESHKLALWCQTAALSFCIDVLLYPMCTDQFMIILGVPHPVAELNNQEIMFKMAL